MQTNLARFIVATSLFDFAFGMFGPFWFLFISDYGGGIEQFSIAIGLMSLASAIASLYAGKLSDIVGRKILLIGSGLGIALLVSAYTIVTSLTMLYLLQIIYGILISVYVTNETSFQGDLTEKQSRGSDIGKIHFYTQISAALAVFLVGFVGEWLGIENIFYIVSLLMCISTVCMLRVKE